MGAVYKARQKSLKREVAIKVLPPTIEDGDMHFAERFKAEAETMARLEHANIIAVYDAGQTPGGLLYFVMQLVQGTDVAQMIRSSGRLPPEHAYAITAHVCDALAYAHANGLIHRDIKPANIMVDTQGRVKVADFGLAKMVTEDSGFTQSNMAVGTPDFVAPEALIPGVLVDGRADLYAVGVMLYQMLTGSIPRGAFKPASVMVPGLDARFDQIVFKAMQVDREERHHSALELRQHLDSILMPAVPAPDLQRYSSAGMPKQAPRPGSRMGVATARLSAGGTAPNGRARATLIPPPKSKTHLFIGIGTAAALAVGAFVMFSGGQQDVARLAKVESAAAQTTKPSSLERQATPAVAARQASSTPKTAETPGGSGDGLKPSTTFEPAGALTLKDGITNTLGMKFLPVKGTEVMFCIHETRRQDYATYAADVPGVAGWWKNQTRNGIPCGDKDDHPVVGTSWEDAVKFCQWLSQKEGKTYRLPTDEEWSIAVGLGRKEKHGKDITPEMLNGKETTEFPWGDDYPPKTKDKAGNYGDTAWTEKFPTEPGLKDYSDGFATTAPVMSFKPNKVGLYDMGGNVWEWVDDWWNAAKTDRVLRGASFGVFGRGGMLSSNRNRNTPDYRDRNYGFRCVMVVR
jgi:hypothetical protein